MHVMIWNYDNFSRQNIESSKICTIFKNSYLFKRVHTSNVIYWGNFQYFKEHAIKKIHQKIF
jgi:hypothetical protein